MSTRTRKPSVKLVAGQAITTSLKVAEAFGKRHDSVLRAIANLECSEEFRARNFAASQYEVKTPTGGTKTLPMYTITRDGFAFLASGFTGKEAAQWKERYIEAFNKLEQAARDKAAAKRLPKPVPPQLPPAPETLEQLALQRLRAVKFEMYFSADGDVLLFSRSRKAITMEPELLADIIADPKSSIGREHLPAIIAAAARRLQ